MSICGGPSLFACSVNIDWSWTISSVQVDQMDLAADTRICAETDIYPGGRAKSLFPLTARPSPVGIQYFRLRVENATVDTLHQHCFVSIKSMKVKSENQHNYPM